MRNHDLFALCLAKWRLPRLEKTKLDYSECDYENSLNNRICHTISLLYQCSPDFQQPNPNVILLNGRNICCVDDFTAAMKTLTNRSHRPLL